MKARCVFNATGVWGDRLRGEVGGERRSCGRLRGSHLLFEAWRLPLAQAIAFFHPDDRRAMFAVPWEGSTLIGTTDVDHRDDLDREPGITRAEFDYILRAAQAEFPSLGLGEADVVSTWSGVRPVIASGANVDPSKEKRDSLILNEKASSPSPAASSRPSGRRRSRRSKRAAERLPGGVRRPARETRPVRCSRRPRRRPSSALARPARRPSRAVARPLRRRRGRA